MKYIYGSFTKRQIKEAAHAMHNDVHKLLLYKDNRIEEKIFENDEAFLIFFQNVMFKFSGTKTLFNNNGIMVEVTSDEFDYMTFRRAILDSHNYIKQMFEGGVGDAKLTDSTANR